MNQVVGQEPTPEFAAIVTEDFQRLLDTLGDDELREIALYKLEGYTNHKISAKVERSLPTIERRFRLIRHKWQENWNDTLGRT